MAFRENRLGCCIIFACFVLLCLPSFSPAESVSEKESKVDSGLEGNRSQHTPLSTPYVFEMAKAGNDSQEDPTNQDEKGEEPETFLPRKKNFYTILGGAVYWQNLGELEHTLSGSGSGPFGDFKDWGYNIEIAYHRLITQWSGNDIQLGIDFGVFFNENERDFQLPIPPGGETLELDLNSRGLYLTPSVRVVIGKYGSTRLFLGAGVGFYMVDFVEQLPEGDEVYEFAEKETIGAYLSAGMGIPLSTPDRLILRIEGKVHFVNFGDLGAFAPGAGDLKGPIYIFQAGITF
jgi:hypothetical protein